MRILIDLGAHDGSGTRDRWGEYDRVYCWEPNRELWHHFDDVPAHVDLVPAAAWKRDGQIEFFIGTDGKMQGSSLFGDKLTGEIADGPVLVNCLALAEWMEGRLPESGEIDMRMDIEGAEYTVIENLRRHGQLRRIGKLEVEWHGHKIPTIRRSEHNRAVEIASYDPHEYIEL